MELRRSLEGVRDLVILYVMADRQVNPKTLRFVSEGGLRERVRFLRDEESAVIRRLGLAKADPEPIEAGVPHPATYLIDRDGVIRFVDVREDFHVWLDPSLLLDALAQIP